LRASNEAENGEPQLQNKRGKINVGGFHVRKQLILLALALVMILSMATPVFAAIPVGLKLYGFEAASFAENGAGEYVGLLKLKVYRLGYKNNKKQANISNSTGSVQYLEFKELAEAPSWTPYAISTQKVSIKQTGEEQIVDFTYSGPVSKGAKTTVRVKIPAKPVVNSLNDQQIQLIESFSISGLVRPVAGELPASLNALSTNGDKRFAIKDIKWSSAPSKAYSALITVEAADGYLFNGNYGALELVTGGKLRNISIGAAGSINLNEILYSDSDILSLSYPVKYQIKKFTFKVTFPTA
jgi:hypothetical protein